MGFVLMNFESLRKTAVIEYLLWILPSWTLNVESKITVLECF